MVVGNGRRSSKDRAWCRDHCGLLLPARNSCHYLAVFRPDFSGIGYLVVVIRPLSLGPLAAGNKFRLHRGPFFIPINHGSIP